MKKKTNKRTSPKHTTKNKRTNRTRNSSRKSGKGRSEREKGLKRAILGLMSSNRKKAYTSKEVLAETGLWKSLSNNQMKSFLDRLTEDGKLENLERGRYRYLVKPRSQVLTGILEVTRSGLGFLLRDQQDDILIPPPEMGKALHGDLVKVRLSGRRRRDKRTEGTVLEIVQRARTEFVGIIEEGLPGRYFFVADDPLVKTDFRIASENIGESKDGEKVLVKMLNWDKYAPEGKVIQVLGEAGSHNTEMHAILLQYGFNPEFPAEVEAEAQKISDKIAKSEIKKRRDIREITTFTIDPVDAKDFDDALSLQYLDNGHYEIGVHIADVSHYVRRGTLIDKEAFKRATSVYLVDRTVPMLPEKLSNRLCSLRPNEDKLTFSAIFEIDGNGKIHKEWFGKTVIHSDYRFHYGEAQDVINGEKEGPFKEELLLLNDIALKLREKRMGTGSIEFETDEVRFELDENGKPIRVVKKERKDSHKLIEDFMLLANRRVAAYIHGIFNDPPLPFVYRIHDHPDPDKLANLGKFAGHFGHKLNFERAERTSDQLNKLLLKVQGKPEQNVIESIAIRSMAKAIYSSNNIGHFGLGFPFYTHFTSPIRRYPDLMVHRLVEQYQAKDYKANATIIEEECKHCSRLERTATEAERASIKYKQVEFLEDKIGQSFKGIISGVIESGFFVELEENLCEGFVPARTLEDDYFAFDSDNYCLRGRETNEVLRLGDPIIVEVAETNLAKRQIEFNFIKKGKLKKVNDKVK